MAEQSKIVNTTYMPTRNKRETKMTTKGKRHMRTCPMRTCNEKIAAIQRVKDGESKASVARNIGVPESTLRGWCKTEDKLLYAMTSRMSSSDTDKSYNGETPEKRARTETPAAALQSPTATSLDLTYQARVTHNVPQPAVPTDTPVERTTKRNNLPQPQHTHRERRPDPGANVSMSAISPLSGRGNLPGLAHSQLGSGYSEIENNLLLEQLNQELAPLQARRVSCALRRSVLLYPKPAHNGMLNLTETSHRSKSNHTSDLYRQSSSNSTHETRQAMLDLTQMGATYPLQMGKASDTTLPTKPVTPAAGAKFADDLIFEYIYRSLLQSWQCAKYLPEDKLKSASQVPKDQSANNILYSHLTKGKHETRQAMFDLTQMGATYPLQMGKASDTTLLTKPVTPAAGAKFADDLIFEYCRSLLQSWQCEKYLPEDKLKSASQVPKDQSANNILYSHLTKGKTENGWTTTSPVLNLSLKPEVRETITAPAEPRVAEQAVSPEVDVENKEPATEKPIKNGKIYSQTGKYVDSLLFKSINQAAAEENKSIGSTNVEQEPGTAEALEHGEKFIAWLEGSSDPSVTRLHVNQLRALLHNLRSRRSAAPATSADATRRK